MLLNSIMISFNFCQGLKIGKIKFGKKKKKKENKNPLRTDLNHEDFIEYTGEHYTPLNLNKDREDISDFYVYGINLMYVYIKSDKLDKLGGNPGEIVGLHTQDVLPFKIHKVLDEIYNNVKNTKKHLQKTFIWNARIEVLDNFPLLVGGKFIGMTVFQRSFNSLLELGEKV